MDSLSSGGMPKTALSSFKKVSRSPFTFRIIVVCFVPPRRTFEYTGKNPMAPFGLFPVLEMVKGRVSRFSKSSGSVGGALHPLGKVFGENIPSNWISSGWENLGMESARLDTRMLAGFFLNKRFNCVFECLNRAFCVPFSSDFLTSWRRVLAVTVFNVNIADCRTVQFKSLAAAIYAMIGAVWKKMRDEG